MFKSILAVSEGGPDAERGAAGLEEETAEEDEDDDDGGAGDDDDDDDSDVDDAAGLAKDVSQAMLTAGLVGSSSKAVELLLWPW